MKYNKYLKCDVDDCIERNGCSLPEEIAKLREAELRYKRQIKILKGGRADEQDKH